MSQPGQDAVRAENLEAVPAVNEAALVPFGSIEPSSNYRS